MLEVKRRDIGSITVLDLIGSLMLGRGSEGFSQHVKQLVEEQRLNVVANIQQLSVIDSAGVGDLVASFSLVKKAGGSLKVASPTQLVRDVLRIARIPTIIEFYDTEQAALDSFASK
jgi:anti-sigma B factor antagonist